MKLLGKDISGKALAEKLEARLKTRGLAEPERPISFDGVVPRVEPSAFYLQALETHADPTVPLPLHTHRAGIGRAVLVAKWAFRKVSHLAVVDMLGRQRVFNGYVRDAFLEAFTELQSLRARLDALDVERAKDQGVVVQQGQVSRM